MGEAKGMVQVLEELGLYVPGMTEKGGVGDKHEPAMSMLKVIGSFVDFKGETCKLEQALSGARGQMCIWLPKYHAPCNSIEYVWGNFKKRNRKTCDFTMPNLRLHGMSGILDTELALIRTFFRKSRDFQNALMLPDTTAINMASVAAKFKAGRMKYKSHVRPAPSEYNSI